MRKPLRIVALALALCLVASQALAWEWPWFKKITRGNTKGDVVVGASHVDSTAAPLPVEDGMVPVYEAVGGRTWSKREPNLLQTRLAVGNQDTTKVVDLSGAKQMRFFLLPTSDSTTCSVVWGVTVRYHDAANADTNSTYKQAFTSTANDSIGSRGFNGYTVAATGRVFEYLYNAPGMAVAGYPRGDWFIPTDRRGVPLEGGLVSIGLRCVGISTLRPNGSCGADTAAGTKSAAIKIGVDAR